MMMEVSQNFKFETMSKYPNSHLQISYQNISYPKELNFTKLLKRSIDPIHDNL